VDKVVKMDEQIKTMLNWTVVWSLVIVFAVLLLNFFMQGFFIKYFKVRASRGKKVLIQVEGLVDRYYTTGIVMDEFLIYKKRHSKNQARLKLPIGATYICLGIKWVNVSESKNAIMTSDYTSVSGYDAELIETLYKRALYKPALVDNKQKLLLGLIIAILIGILVLGFMIYQNYQQTLGLGTI